jgi:hypothetical protein
MIHNAPPYTFVEIIGDFDPEPFGTSPQKIERRGFKKFRGFNFKLFLKKESRSCVCETSH